MAMRNINDDTTLAYLLKKAKLDAHPVGSIYMSMNSVSPNKLFGGAWEQVNGSFSIASGTTCYAWKRIA